MSLANDLETLGALMKTNLEAKGITGLTGNEGLTTLANTILNISSGSGGIEIDTALTCSVSSSHVVKNDNVVVTATLTASYDDTIDLNDGKLAGATINFYANDGREIMGSMRNLGSAVTNSNGVATITVSPDTIGDWVFYAEFNGTALYDDSTSSDVNVLVSEAVVSMVVSATKDVLSYADSESSTITVLALDRNSQPVPGVTVTFKNGSTVLGTDTTGAIGEASYTYVSSGAGDVTISVECMSLQETYVLEDLKKYIYDDCSTGVPSDNYDVVESGLTAYTNYNGYNCMYQQDNSRIELGTFTEFEFEADFCIPGQWAFTGLLKNGTLYINTTPSTDCGGAIVCSKNAPHGANKWFTFRTVVKNNHIDLYVDNILKVSEDVVLEQATWSIRGGTNTNPRYTKNVKLKVFS